MELNLNSLNSRKAKCVQNRPTCRVIHTGCFYIIDCISDLHWNLKSLCCFRGYTDTRVKFVCCFKHCTYIATPWTVHSHVYGGQP
jgi:hypothetical protein